jgi:hypothetical protein
VSLDNDQAMKAARNWLKGVANGTEGLVIAGYAHEALRALDRKLGDISTAAERWLEEQAHQTRFPLVREHASLVLLTIDSYSPLVTKATVEGSAAHV